MSEIIDKMNLSFHGSTNLQFLDDSYNIMIDSLFFSKV